MTNEVLFFMITGAAGTLALWPEPLKDRALQLSFVRVHVTCARHFPMTVAAIAGHRSPCFSRNLQPKCFRRMDETQTWKWTLHADA